MPPLLTYFLNELLAPILCGTTGVLAAAYINYRLEIKKLKIVQQKSYGEKLGEQKAAKRIALYEELLQCLFSLQMNPTSYIDSSFLAKMCLISARLTVYSSSTVTSCFAALLDEIRGRRASYIAECRKSESENFQTAVHEARNPDDESYEQREPKNEAHLRFYQQDCERALNDYCPSASYIADVITRLTTLVRNDLQKSDSRDKKDD